MSSLGQLEVIRADKSFDSETAGPTLPGSDRSRSGSKARNTHQASNTHGLDVQIANSLAETLDAAISKATYARSSTTLTALAASYEALGAIEESVATATEALQLSVISARERGFLIDPVSARLAIEILIRAGRTDEGTLFATSLPLVGQVRLSVGAMLASVGRLEEAHRFVDDSDAQGRDAVCGFLQIMEGNNYAAISSLRAALRTAPDDADSALNLSIAFWRVGAKKKAISTALQATRSAPGRQDVGLHYLELLIAEGDFERFDREIASLARIDVAPPARLFILRARATLARGDIDTGVKLLERASEAAKAENDDQAFAEVQSNLIRIRAWNGKIDRELAVTRLLKLHVQFPTSAVVLVSLAQVANRRRHTTAMQNALELARGTMSDARIAFVEHQIASLEGNNELAAEKAVEWYTLEPEDPNASIAAVVALGIGQERWEEAAEFAREALLKYPNEPDQINNAAYVLAMVGDAEEAIKLLTPHAKGRVVLTATLGLAYLASNQIHTGMKLYREAANMAEQKKDDSRSLMTAYQALVVRQLGLLNASDLTALTAMSLPPVALPDDWRERSEFLRLQTLAADKGYEWPLTL
jgi:tetratricopeptide (TPR) repeat protein